MEAKSSRFTKESKSWMMAWWYLILQKLQSIFSNRFTRWTLCSYCKLNTCGTCTASLSIFSGLGRSLSHVSRRAYRALTALHRSPIFISNASSKSKSCKLTTSSVKPTVWIIISRSKAGFFSYSIWLERGYGIHTISSLILSLTGGSNIGGFRFAVFRHSMDICLKRMVSQLERLCLGRLKPIRVQNKKPPSSNSSSRSHINRRVSPPAVACPRRLKEP